MASVLREIDGRLVSSRLLTFKDAAAYLSVSVRTVYRWVGEGQLRVRRAAPGGGCDRIDVQDLDLLIETMPEGGPNPEKIVRASRKIRASDKHRPNDDGVVRIHSLGGKRG